MAPIKNKPFTPPAPKKGWAPPESAKPIILAEFHKFETVDEYVIGQITTDVMQPNFKKNGDQRVLTLAPVVVISPKGEAAVYGDLAIGCTAHLTLLMRDLAVGDCVAIKLAGERPAQIAGQNPSKQFEVYQLTAEDMMTSIREYVAEADLPF